MNRQERKELCLKWFQTLSIGDEVTDVKYGRKNKVTNITSTSIELYHTKVSDKGINYKQWYDIDRLSDLTNDFL